MKIPRFLLLIVTLMVAACLQSCVTAPKDRSIIRASNDPSAGPAMCKVKATRVAGVIQIEIPKFEKQLQDTKDALVLVLKAYVEDTMTLNEGESEEFEIDLNALMKSAKALQKDGEKI